jgi:uncharacterized phage-associated protein
MLKKGERVAAKAIAGWFVNAADRDAGEVTTHLKVQKLVYYTQAWYLANFDRPLFDEDMQAWTHGPVSPSVYEKYRGAGFDALPLEGAPRIPGALVPFLKAVYEKYGQYTAKRLEKLTHEESPWKVTRGNLPIEARCTKPIDKLLIRNFYAARLGKKEISKFPN